MKDFTRLHGWQFFLLADHLKDLIENPRLHPDGTRPANNIHSKCKLDHFHRLYYCLKWLNDGNFYKTQEADIGYGKSSIHEDTIHVLQAIVEGLEDEIQWPDAEKRQELAAVFPGMFHGCIGVADVKEYQVVKYLDPVKKDGVGRRKSIVTNYCLLWITQDITFLPTCDWEKMIVKSLLLVLCIYRKVNSSRLMNS
jgi:hypothetical protein